MRLIIIEADTDLQNVGKVEELILAKAQLKTIDEGYQELQLPTPDWVTDKLMETSQEISMRVKAELQRKLREMKARRSALRTADEKRKDLDTGIEELEKLLQ